MSSTFKKKPEDFICGHCGLAVAGNGYTNHCPACLYSKHVDVWPGDRAARCGGLMPAIGYVALGNDYILIHRCERCQHEKRNKMVPGDDLAQLAALV